MPSSCVIRVSHYLFDASTAAEAIKKLALRKPVTVLIEAPQGFLQFMLEFGNRLVDCLGTIASRVAIEYRLEPSYGACDVGADTANADIVIHLGHEYYPYPVRKGNAIVIKVSGEYQYDESLVRKLANKLLETDPPLILTYSYQHSRLASEIAEIVQGEGIDIVLTPTPVLGCFTTHVHKLAYHRGARSVVVLSGGRFHALGVGLTILPSHSDVKVYSLDPYTTRLEDMTILVTRTLQKRYWRLKEALSARTYGIVVGLKPGQYRPWIVSQLEKLLAKAGRRYYILVSSRLTREDLDNIGPREPEVFVITSCPRLAIEDFGDYWRPVLTPGEARMVLTGRLDKYLFPW